MFSGSVVFVVVLLCGCPPLFIQVGVFFGKHYQFLDAVHRRQPYPPTRTVPKYVT